MDKLRKSPRAVGAKSGADGVDYTDIGGDVSYKHLVNIVGNWNYSNILIIFTLVTN